jgi:hypothetical protein
MSRDKARISILSSLLSFPTINQKDWTSGIDNCDVIVGDLVSLCSAPESKWYLSWVKEIEKMRHDTRYLLESIEDGSLCWWSNVGVNVYDRERVKNRPSWKWSDREFAFNSRWHKACRRNDSYIVLPCSVKFLDKYSVELDVRIRFGFSDFSNTKVFTDWRKLTIKEMESYYLECVEIYQNRVVKSKPT